MKTARIIFCLLFVGIWHPVFAQSSGEKTLGITREQADAILLELHQIRQLLEKQTQSAQENPIKDVQITVAHDWHVMGRADAPITIVEFTDLECHFCRLFHNETFPLIKTNYIDTGKVRFVSRDLPLPQAHPYAVRAAEAARCAGDQGKYWEVRDAMLQIPTINEDALRSSAKAIVSDDASFRGCMDSEKYKAAVSADVSEAASLHLEGTPTFILARSKKDTLNGIQMTGAGSYTTFQQKIDELLKVQ
jgi:protein-disulfide isomerase